MLLNVQTSIQKGLVSPRIQIGRLHFLQMKMILVIQDPKPIAQTIFAQYHLLQHNAIVYIIGRWLCLSDHLLKILVGSGSESLWRQIGYRRYGFGTVGGRVWCRYISSTALDQSPGLLENRDSYDPIQRMMWSFRLVEMVDLPTTSQHGL